MLDHLIVDGYNVLHAWRNRPGAQQKGLSQARLTLLRDLELAAATRGVHCTVVFDGQPIEDVAHASSAHLEVVFAGPRQSADAVIERLVCRSQQKGLSPCGTGPFAGAIVVTDDRLLGTLAIGWGARCWSTTRLAQWLAAPP
ncbi:MAG: NYN domain-containing protein [Candidatus Omnitrophica bacterium]|nr:NYN domain-containing protein [Candidatus Omnitrophota bacterium]